MKQLTQSIVVFRKAPFFAGAALATLAIGFGAVGLAGGALNRILLHPLQFPEPGELVTVYSNIEIMGATKLGVSPPLYLDLTDQYREADFGAYLNVRQNLETGSPTRVSVTRATPSLFSVLRVGPERGAGFSARDEAREVVLSNAFWRGHFGADPVAIGATLMLDGVPHEIVGVMPATFSYPSRETDLWSSLTVPRSVMDDRSLRGDHRLTVVGRFDGAGGRAEVAAATGSFNRWINETVATYSPETGFTVSVLNLEEEVTAGTRSAVALLTVAALAVLGIVVANVANLMLFRTQTRRAEFSLRLALGALRSRVFTQLLWESFTLTTVGGLVALPLIALALRWVGSNASGFVPESVELGLDLATALSVLLVSGLVGLVMGFVTFRQAIAGGGVSIVGSARGASASRTTRIFSNSMVVVQVTLSFVLLSGSGLLYKSYRSLQEADPGLEAENLVAVTVALPEVRYANMPRVVSFANQFSDRVRSVPGVTDVSVMDFLPLREIGEEVPLWNEQRVQGVDPIMADIQFPLAGYFATAGVQAVSGRRFLTTDIEGSLPVAVINRTAADRHFEGDAVGQRIEIFQDDQREIVGVVEDVHFRSLEIEPRAQVYVPLAQYPAGPLWRGDLMRLIRELTLVVRAGGDPQSVASSVRRELAEIDPLIPISSVSLVSDVVRSSLAARTTLLSVLSVFAFGALVLGVVGVYSVLAFAVSQRRREMGIRISLGATSADVVKVVALPSVALVSVGVGVGLAVFTFGSNAISGFLSGTGALDPLVLVASIGVVMTAGAVASVLPARRASRVDPVTVLREE